jgi:hypothetical protein
MPDNEVPGWVLRAMRDAEEQMRLARPYVEQVRKAAEFAQSMMPAYRYAEQYAEQVRQVVEVARLMAPIVESMKRHADQVQQALAAAEMLFGYFDRAALAMATGTTAPPILTASANLTATSTLTVRAEVVEVADRGDVDVQPDARPETLCRIDYAAQAISLLWAWALLMPLLAARLSSTDQTVLLWYITTITLALIITWRYNDNHKR